MRWLLFMLFLGFSAAALAQPPMSREQAIADDAFQYAAQFGVDPLEAQKRLKLQQSSTAALDAIRTEFEPRLAGIAIEHVPTYRFVVLLTGNDPVAERNAAGIPTVFRTGARTTRAQAVAAMRRHLIDFRTELPGARGAGYDQRTGEVVLLVTPSDVARYGAEAIRQRAESLAGVSVRVVTNALNETNMGIDGGGRVEGLNAANRRSRCTTGFVVTNGETTAITTAAHCADQLTYIDRDGSSSEMLPMIGSWGLGYRDVQLNGSARSTRPYFYADRGADSLREVTTWRSLASTPAGEFVCHYGETTGYSCATVALTDYAPPGALCGGPCSPTWVTVRGPWCQPGDSGGPVFSGSVAYGLAKGVNRDDAGGCLFYYYMSVDFLPPPWRVLTTSDITRQRRDRP